MPVAAAPRCGGFILCRPATDDTLFDGRSAEKVLFGNITALRRPSRTAFHRPSTVPSLPSNDLFHCAGDEMDEEQGDIVSFACPQVAISHQPHNRVSTPVQRRLCETICGVLQQITAIQLRFVPQGLPPPILHFNLIKHDMTSDKVPPPSSSLPPAGLAFRRRRRRCRPLRPPLCRPRPRRRRPPPPHPPPIPPPPTPPPPPPLSAPPPPLWPLQSSPGSLSLSLCVLVHMSVLGFISLRLICIFGIRVRDQPCHHDCMHAVGC